MKKLVFIILVIVLCSCGKNPDPSADGGKDIPAENVKVSVAVDRTSIIKNPLTGWALYVGRTWDDTFWSTQGYDSYATSEGTNVKVSDYASCIYLRTSWSNLEPTEGNYAWKNESSSFYKLVKSARDRGLRLALRIVVDGRDQGLNTPQYVFDAGAQWYADNGNVNRKSAYPDDPVFQEKYAKFIRALAEEFNDTDKMEFIDAYGLGKWGEGHTLIYKDKANKAAVFHWIVDLYASTFTKVPLVINYHRLIADTTEWNDKVPAETEGLLSYCIEKGYSLRHDAFGMSDYFKTWEKDFAKKWNFKRPIIMEGGWITGGTHRYWIDSSGKYREGHPEDVRKGEFDASAEARVNMMDLRTNDETRTWFGLCFDLVKKLNQEGGYRVYPNQVSLPKEAASGAKVEVDYRWINLGWGYLPNNIPQWNYKYKVAMALLDANRKPAFVYVDKEAEPSEWLLNAPKTYKFNIELKDVPSGEYTWAIAIVDTTKDNTPGIRLSVPAKNLTTTGWLKLETINIK